MQIASIRSVAVALWLAAAAPVAAVETRATPSLLDAIELWLVANSGSRRRPNLPLS